MVVNLPLPKLSSDLVVQVVPEDYAFLVEFELLVVLLKDGFVARLLEGLVIMCVMLQVNVELSKLCPQGFVCLALLIQLSEQDNVLQFFEEELKNRVFIVLYLGECPGHRH